MSRHPADAGFTLLELLVALLVLGLVIAGLAQGTRFGIRAADTQNRMGGAIAELDGVDRTLRRLLEAADPGTDRTPAPFAGGPATLVFAAPLPLSALSPGTPALHDVALGLDPAGRVLLRTTPHRHVEPLGPPPPAAESLLLRGVAELELAYWDGQWRTGWTETPGQPAPGLPSLIRIRIRFPPGDARSWPDIVVAPRRSVPRG